ncbi:MAG: glycosyltransferase family 4 protein [Thermoplasmata archaeon]
MRVTFFPLHRFIVSQRGSEFTWAINLARAVAKNNVSCTAVVGQIDAAGSEQMRKAGIHVRSLGVPPSQSLQGDVTFFAKLLVDWPNVWPNCDVLHHVYPVGFGHGFNPSLLLQGRRPVVIGPLSREHPEDREHADNEIYGKLLGDARSLRDRPQYPSRIFRSLYARMLGAADLLLFDNVESRSVITGAFPAARTTPAETLGGGGIDPTEFDPSLRSGSPHDPVRVGTLCYFRPRKHVATLIRAVARLRDQRIHLVIGGDGPGSNSLRALARELDVEKSVTFMGVVPRASVPGFLASLDVYCMPDRFPRSELPSVQEAMMLGLPVIVSPPERADRLQRIPYGFLADADDAVAFAEAIIELATDPALAQKMGSEGLQRARLEFSLDAVGSKLCQIYASVSK